MSPIELGSGVVVAGRYQLEERLGEGGFGEVFRARDRNTSQEVAVKLLREDLFESAGGAREVARFERETQLLAKLRHPNIVRLIDAGSFEGRLFMVLEFVVGEPLDHLLHREKKLSAPEARHLMTQEIGRAHV